ncbi:hypothetical protein P9911_003900 [Klebsiella oxytoca]|uniref:hypothetical protein n=1 Tax=Klebsiella oxytoca TaxID=571 RepID=UPI00254BFA95|nr:hypothetical protein [Klebsiella oxytoca]MEC5504993.1 hypothetical protein [Klebsiella oxytoca]
MTFSLLRTSLGTLCLTLSRLFFLWPALLLGGVMLVMVFLSHQGGVASRLNYYSYEAARWRNAPEGSLMVRRCIDAAADNAVFPVAPLSRDEWRVMVARETDCPTVTEPFELAAENDIRFLHLLMKMVLTISFCLEVFMTVRGRRGRNHSGAVTHVRMANGSVRIVREKDNE